MNERLEHSEEQSGHRPGKEKNLTQRKSEQRIIYLYINIMVHCTTI